MIGRRYSEAGAPPNLAVKCLDTGSLIFDEINIAMNDPTETPRYVNLARLVEKLYVS